MNRDEEIRRDVALMRRAKRGNAWAKQRLISLVTGYAIHRVRKTAVSSHDREDCLQDVFVALLEGVRRYDESHQTPWMVFASHCVSDGIGRWARTAKRGRRFSPTSAECALDEVPHRSSGVSLVDAIDFIEKAPMIVERERGPRHALMFKMHHIDGMSCQEIAQSLGLTRQAIDKSVRASRKVLASTT